MFNYFLFRFSDLFSKPNIVVTSAASLVGAIFLGILIYKLGPLIWLFIKRIFGSKGVTEFAEANDFDELQKALDDSGFAYDIKEDIFYSKKDSWQRDFGYCQLYDEAAPSMSMIVDSEPVRFEYGGKNWLLEFWKGQYGMTSGGEIGLYYADGPDLHIPGVFDGTFYKAAEDKDMLKMAFVLKKNKNNLFFRYDNRHWWLTGFKLGEFSEPEELSMVATIAFSDSEMCRAFYTALRRLGYTEVEMSVSGRTVRFIFDKPKSRQPITRTKITDSLTQRKNKILCDAYKDIAKENLPTIDRLRIIAAKSPELSQAVLNFGRTKELYSSHDLIESAKRK